MTKTIRFLLIVCLTVALAGCSALTDAIDNVDRVLDNLSNEESSSRSSWDDESSRESRSSRDNRDNRNNDDDDDNEKDDDGDDDLFDDDDDDWDGADSMRIQETATYYNGYSGVALTLPQGWYVNLPIQNLSETPDETNVLSALYSESLGDGGFGVNLAYLENADDDSLDYHASAWFYLEAYYGLIGDMQEYLEYNIDYWSASRDGYEYTLTDWETVTLQGTSFEKITFQVDHSGNTVPYIQEYYVTAVGDPQDEVYLVGSITYWIDNTKGIQDANYMMEECIQVSGALSFSVTHPEITGGDVV